MSSKLNPWAIFSTIELYIGFRLEVWGGGGTGAGDYIPAPALTPIATTAYNSSTNRRNSSGYGYDLAGNLTQETVKRTMTYDAENRMVTFNGGSGTSTYYYDGEGRRVKKLDNAGVTSESVYNAIFMGIATQTESYAQSFPPWRSAGDEDVADFQLAGLNLRLAALIRGEHKQIISSRSRCLASTSAIG